MKYEATIEDDRTGEQFSVEVELAAGQSLIQQVAQQQLSFDWNLLDVTPVYEAEEPVEPDPDFPNRPMHPDFARLSAASIRMDELSKTGSPPEVIGIDPDSLLYGLANRMGAALSDPIVSMMPIEVQVQGAWLDGFAVGIEYQKRGGSSPIETGNTGDKEGAQ